MSETKAGWLLRGTLANAVFAVTTALVALACSGDPRAAVITGTGTCRTATFRATPGSWYRYGWAWRADESLVNSSNPVMAYLPRKLSVISASGKIPAQLFLYYRSGLFYLFTNYCSYAYSPTTNAYEVYGSCPVDVPTTATALVLGSAENPQNLTVEAILSPWSDSNPCTVDTCHPATGPSSTPAPAGTLCSTSANVCRQASTCNGAGACLAGAALPAGTSCSNGNPCDGYEKCSGTGTCQLGTALSTAQVDDHDPCTNDSCDPSRGGVVNEPIAGCYASAGTPAPDAQWKTTSQSFGDSTEFLYAGTSPIQTGVAPGTIDKTRVSVIRGRVLQSDGTTPAAGATVAILDHPEYGHTLTRSDGWYDLAVNGGGPLTVDVMLSGYLRVQRHVLTKWKGFSFVDEIVLTAPYASPDSFVVGAATGQVVHGATTPVGEDADGSRQALVYFPPGTVSTNYAVSDGTPLAVEVTEYTRANGPRRMPGELPATSGYTYAVEVSLPAAIAAGVQDVEFSKDVSLYVTNFTGYPVGQTVPLGYYDRAKGAWVGDNSGRIIKIITAPAGGEATIDIDGNGTAESPAQLDAFGIDSAERTMLTFQYAAGVQLWRSAVRRFSAWDYNWSFGPPPDATPPPPPPPGGDGPDDGCKRPGSIIGCESRTLEEEIPIVGAPFSLHYQSTRSAGFRSQVRVRISDGTTLPSSFLRAHVEIQAAGRRYEYFREPPLPANEMMTWTWDGLDAYGRLVEQGTTEARVRVGYEYTGTQTFATATFGASRSSSTAITGNRQARTVTLWQETSVPLRRADAKPLGFGGWTLGVHHVLDNLDRLTMGDGTQRSLAGSEVVPAYQIDTVAGGGEYSYPTLGDGGPATNAYLGNIEAIIAAPDGSLYIAHDGFNNDGGRIRRVAPNGTISTVAGLLPVVARTDGMAALHAQIWPTSLALAPDGSIVFAEGATGKNRVWKIEPGASPTLRLVAGCIAPTCAPGIGDGGPATDATLTTPSSIAVAPDGSVFIAESGSNSRVRRVGLEGTITTYYTSSGLPRSLSLREDGVLFMDTSTSSLVRIEPSGSATTVTDASVGTVNLQSHWCEGTGSFYGFVHALPDASFLLSCYNRIIKRTPMGTLLRLAGPSTPAFGFGGDGAAAIRALLFQAKPLAVGSNGDIFIGDRGNLRVRRLRPPAGDRNGTRVRIPSADGNEIYEFSLTGRHERTLSALRGTPLYTLAYDAVTNQLTSVTDQAGNVTQIVRSTGSITITTPFNHVTTLALDANGYLASVTSPKTDEVTQLVHTESGLLTDLVDANGHAHHFEYESDGQLTKDVDATPGSLGQRLAMNATPTGWTVSITSAAGRLKQYEVQRAGNFGDRGIQERRRIRNGAGLETIIDKYIDGAGASSSPTGSTSIVRETKADPRWGTLASYPSKVDSIVGSHPPITRQETRGQPALAIPGDPFSVSAQTITTMLSANGMANAVTTRVFAAGPPATWTTTSPAGRQTKQTLDGLERVTEIAVLGSSPVTLYPIYSSITMPSAVSTRSPGDRASSRRRSTRRPDG
jgi:hypothetical protein